MTLDGRGSGIRLTQPITHTDNVRPANCRVLFLTVPPVTGTVSSGRATGRIRLAASPSLSSGSNTWAGSVVSALSFSHQLCPGERVAVQPQLRQLSFAVTLKFFQTRATKQFHRLSGVERHIKETRFREMNLLILYLIRSQNIIPANVISARFDPLKGMQPVCLLLRSSSLNSATAWSFYASDAKQTDRFARCKLHKHIHVAFGCEVLAQDRSNTPAGSVKSLFCRSSRVTAVSPSKRKGICSFRLQLAAEGGENLGAVAGNFVTRYVDPCMHGIRHPYRLRCGQDTCVRWFYSLSQ